MPNKVKITQKEFDEIYQIEEPLIVNKEITEETLDVPSAKQEDTTPEFLTEEEQEQEKEYLENYQVPKDYDYGD